MAVIRPAAVHDLDELLAMIGELAAFERSSESVEITPEQLRAALFGGSPTAFAHVADDGGRVVGMAIWYLTFSTWTGRPGIYLADLFVRPGARRSGTGRALVAELASIACRSGYGRIEWSVLDWNDGAIAFYRSLGAVPLDQWVGYRLAGDALDSTATEPS